MKDRSIVYAPAPVCSPDIAAGTHDRGHGHADRGIGDPTSDQPDRFIAAPDASRSPAICPVARTCSYQRLYTYPDPIRNLS